MTSQVGQISIATSKIGGLSREHMDTVLHSLKVVMAKEQLSLVDAAAAAGKRLKKQEETQHDRNDDSIGNGTRKSGLAKISDPVRSTETKMLAEADEKHHSHSQDFVRNMVDADLLLPRYLSSSPPMSRRDEEIGTSEVAR